MARSYNDDGDGFEKFQKKPKNYKKGKDNRSNQKQYLRSHFKDDTHLEDDAERYEEWDRK